MVFFWFSSASGFFLINGLFIDFSSLPQDSKHFVGTTLKADSGDCHGQQGCPSGVLHPFPVHFGGLFSFT